MCIVPGGLGGIGDPVEGPDNVRSDGVHYLRLPVLEPLEFFPVFCFPPFLFLALRPELESLSEAAAFWAGAFFSEFFLVRGVDFAFLFVEAPPVGEWPLCPFFAFVKLLICFFKRSTSFFNLLFSERVSLRTSSWSCSRLAASSSLTRMSASAVDFSP